LKLKLKNKNFSMVLILKHQLFDSTQGIYFFSDLHSGCTTFLHSQNAACLTHIAVHES
jgi:hypothetical protein